MEGHTSRSIWETSAIFVRGEKGLLRKGTERNTEVGLIWMEEGVDLGDMEGRG